MVDYLVTKKLEDIPVDRPIVMVDGALRNWSPGLNCPRTDSDVQIQKLGLFYVWPKNDDAVFFTTFVDADACTAAAWIQLTAMYLPKSEMHNAFMALSAIAYCDHSRIPLEQEWDPYRKFAATAVAAMKGRGYYVALEMRLPENQREWSDADRKRHASEVFRVHTQWLIDAAMGKCPWPGERNRPT